MLGGRKLTIRGITRVRPESMKRQAGSPCFQTIAGTGFGVVIRREIIFPKLWSEYQATGAQIVFHINNAMQLALRRHCNRDLHSIQFFVHSSNN